MPANSCVAIGADIGGIVAVDGKAERVQNRLHLPERVPRVLPKRARLLLAPRCNRAAQHHVPETKGATILAPALRPCLEVWVLSVRAGGLWIGETRRCTPPAESAISLCCRETFG